MKYPDLDEPLRRAIEVRTTELKKMLFRWIQRTSGPEDALPMTAAFLEMAIEGHLAMNDGDAAATRTFLTSTLERMVPKIFLIHSTFAVSYMDLPPQAFSG